MDALPQFGPWVSCCMIWCVGTSHLNTTRRSQKGRSSSGGEFPQVNSHCDARFSLLLSSVSYFMLCLVLQTYWLSSSFSRMPAADQVVSVSAAGWPSILWGHHQPLVDAEHILLRGPIHRSDREDDRRDPAAQHQPRAHSLHAHPCGRGSVMEARSGLLWPELETITEDLCNRLEAERWGGLCTRCTHRQEQGVKDYTKRRSASWQSRHPLNASWQATPSPPQLLDFPGCRPSSASEHHPLWTLI